MARPELTRTYGRLRLPAFAAVPVCPVSGKRPGPRCPTITEWFRPTRHRSATILRNRGQPGPAGRLPRRLGIAVRLLQPTPGLHRHGPAHPRSAEAFPFRCLKGLQRTG
jgi:hypothetical protein